jgi:uncharacterized protein YdeI (YjbR/CyaY-like superfamily)
MLPALRGQPVKTFYAESAQAWRDWLARNGESESEVWLVLYHAGCGTPSPRYHQAIEHALRYGWVDSQQRKNDAVSCMLRFTPRRPGSTWSAVNRERAAAMTAKGQMTARGQSVIDQAKAAGAWLAGTEIPMDLRAALDANAAAAAHFQAFPPSSRRLILDWIASAKRSQTRDQRVAATVALAAQNIRAR